MFARLAHFSFIVLAFSQVHASEPDWSRGFSVQTNGRANPYAIAEEDLAPTIRAGKLHALHYPVEVTGMLFPLRPLKLLNEKLGMRFLGLQSFPKEEGTGVYYVPFQKDHHPENRMGFTVMETPRGKGFTVSCAQCHTGNLFGKKVIGLTNRFPRANLAFVLGKEMTRVDGSDLLRLQGATRGEIEMYREARENLKFIGAIKPVQLGLDTSLAHVALSLAKRAKDGWATKIPGEKARQEPLATFHADSKPAVWWNVKYKNRFLSDGSVVSGNPIFTNILWNEIGRGTDLHKLDQWLKENDNIIRELTTAVFSSEAPRFTDFFPAEKIDLEKAKHGQKLFNQACSKCHGTYEKAWDQPNASELSIVERLRTLKVDYNPKKPVFDVGTDPQRYQGMKSLVQLNDLEISKRNGIVIEAQQGYVPPPLVGIWARWPYFHNNSAPSLCAVLTRHEKRPVTYWAREANDKDKDFDSVCNGYPTGKPKLPLPKYFYDTRRKAMSNSGHDERIFLKDGQEIYTGKDKLAIIQFLQTL